MGSPADGYAKLVFLRLDARRRDSRGPGTQLPWRLWQNPAKVEARSSSETQTKLAGRARRAWWTLAAASMPRVITFEVEGHGLLAFLETNCASVYSKGSFVKCIFLQYTSMLSVQVVGCSPQLIGLPG